MRLGQGGGAAGWHTDDVAQLSHGNHEDTNVSVTRKNTLGQCLLDPNLVSYSYRPLSS